MKTEKIKVENWEKVYSTRNYAEASIIQGVLTENEIPVQVLNKQDSSYVNFGDIELYVPAHLKGTAQQLLGKALLN
jgi:hypothetical protein